MFKRWIPAFDPKEVSSWVGLVNNIKIVPDLYIIEAISSCLLIRKSMVIKNPLIAFLIAIVVGTFSENYFSTLNGTKMAVFESNALVPIVGVIFVMFNFSPFDIIFRIFWFLSPLLALVDGYLIGRAMTYGIDMATSFYQSNWILVIVIGVIAASSKYILVYVIAKIIKSERKARSPGPVIFITAVAALAYYWFTDLGHLSNRLLCDREEMRFYLVVMISFLMFIRLCVSDLFFTKLWNMVGEIGWLIPYYGKMWIPLRVESNQTGIENAHGEQTTHDVEQKTDQDTAKDDCNQDTN